LEFVSIGGILSNLAIFVLVSPEIHELLPTPLEKFVAVVFAEHLLLAFRWAIAISIPVRKKNEQTNINKQT